MHICVDPSLILIKKASQNEKKKEYYSAYAYIELSSGRISGNFTKEHFLEACQEYIAENNNETIAPLLKRRDEMGNLLFDYNTAYIQIIKTLFIRHYGN